MRLLPRCSGHPLVVVRAARYDEAGQIKAVAKQHRYTNHFSHPAYCNRQRFERGWNLVAADRSLDPEVFVGFASIRVKVRKPETEVDIIGTVESARSQGVGAVVLDHIRTMCPHRCLVLNVMKDNGAAIRFYERYGFSRAESALGGAALRMEFRW